MKFFIENIVLNQGTRKRKMWGVKEYMDIKHDIFSLHNLKEH